MIIEKTFENVKYTFNLSVGDKVFCIKNRDKTIGTGHFTLKKGYEIVSIEPDKYPWIPGDYRIEIKHNKGYTDTFFLFSFGRNLATFFNPNTFLKID